jgi:dynein heavy chain, axonemal
MKIERHLETIKEGTFRRGADSGIFHKNMFMGLCYLHGVLDGRRAYGPLGWHVVYEFDNNDFEISD